MKNFALLLSAMAVASSAFAAAPEVNGSLAKTSNAAQPVKATASVCNSGKVRVANQIIGKKVINNVPTRADELSVSYNEPAGLFALGLTDGFNGFDGFSYRKGPAYTPLTWTNTSVGATDFEWEVLKDFSTGETQIFKADDFTYSETYSIVNGPILYGMDAAGNADVFQIGAPKTADGELDAPRIAYFFGGDCEMDEGYNFGMSSYLYGNNGGGYSRFACLGYNPSDKENNPETGLDPVYTDPDPEGLGYENVKFKGYVNVFKQPATPYYVTKMWTWMYVKANKATNVEINLYKIDEDGLVTDEIVASGEAALAKSKKAAESLMLSFDLFALDEDGLQTDEPIVIDCPVAAVMTFNLDDIDEVNTIGGCGAVAPADSDLRYPTNAYILLEINGEEKFQYSPYRYYTDDTLSALITVTDFMWMLDATFPWTYAADGITEIKAPNEGGTVSFNISSYYGIQYFGYYLPEDCDWIDMETATVSENQDLRCQVLNLPVAALPEGVEGRSATIEVEGIGTELTLVVTQGEGNAVSTIVVDKNAEYFDLAGRRVANPEKGIYIKKTGNKAEKVLF